MGIKVSVCMLQHDQMTTLPMTTITKQNDFNIMKLTVRVRLPSAGVGRKMAALASPCSVILQKKTVFGCAGCPEVVFLIFA